MPGIPEFIATAGSEALDTESPRSEDVAGVEVPTDAPDRTGTTPMEEVDSRKKKRKIPMYTSGGSERVNLVERGW